MHTVRQMSSESTSKARCWFAATTIRKSAAEADMYIRIGGFGGFIVCRANAPFQNDEGIGGDARHTRSPLSRVQKSNVVLELQLHEAVQLIASIPAAFESQKDTGQTKQNADKKCSYQEDIFSCETIILRDHQKETQGLAIHKTSDATEACQRLQVLQAHSIATSHKAVL